MKQIFLTVLAMIICCTSAYASAVTATANEKEIKITQTQEMSDRLIAAFYDENGTLSGVEAVNADNGEYTITKREYGTMKLYDLTKTSYEVEIQITPSPNPTVSPRPTSQPRPTPNPAYEKEVDAIMAFAVVTKISTSVDGDNDECYQLECLYQDKEVTIQMPTDTEITSAPTAFASLKGETVSSLKAGDVIYVKTSISGNMILELHLLYRPANVFEGNSFYDYFTTSGKTGGMWNVVPYGSKAPSDRYTYAFGVVAQKYDNSLLLYSHSGLSEDAVEIEFIDDTITYLCDMENRPVYEISKPAAIKKSKISKAAIDDDDNITYHDDYTYSLALVRLVDDVAADVIVYQNVKF